MTRKPKHAYKPDPDGSIRIQLEGPDYNLALHAMRQCGATTAKDGVVRALKAYAANDPATYVQDVPSRSLVAAGARRFLDEGRGDVARALYQILERMEQGTLISLEDVPAGVQA